jgi:hypothetical protein
MLPKYNNNIIYNVCYDGKEYNGVLRESKRNAKIQIKYNKTFFFEYCLECLIWTY